MQYVEFIVTRPTTGAALPGGKVTVYLAGTTTLATLYNAAGGGISNPATADASGLIGFAAANGSYDYSTASADGSYVVPTIHRQQLYDLSGLDAQVTLAQSAASAAATIAATIAPRTDDDKLVLAERRTDLTGSSVIPVGDGSYTVTGDANTNAPITQAMRDKGTIYIVAYASATLDSAQATQKTAANATVGSTINLTKVGNYYIGTLVPDASGASVAISLYKGGAAYTTWISAASATPVSVPGAGNYYAALGNAAIATDGLNLLSTTVDYLQSGTINADGTVSIPAGGGDIQSRISFATGASMRLNDLTTLVVRTVGTPKVSNIRARFGYYNAGGGDGYTYGSFFNFGKQIAPGFYVSEPIALNADGLVPGVIEVRVTNGDSVAAVVSFSAFGPKGVPAQTKTPAVVTKQAQALIDASRKPVAVSGPVLLSTGTDTTQTIRINADSFEIAQAVDRRIMTMTTLDRAVNTGGSNSAAGGLETPYATLDKAYSVTADGDTIGLRNNQTHSLGRGSASPLAVPGGRNLTGYGDGGPANKPARIDVRQHLGALTWTSVGGGVYEAVATLAYPFGTTGNPTSFLVWNGDTMLAMQVGGANIAANQTACAATENTFEVHKTGSTQQNILAEGSGFTGVTLRVHLTGGVSPTSAGMDVSLADYPFVAQFARDRRYENLTFIGGYEKNMTNVTANDSGGSKGPALLVNCTMQDFSGHGIVGTCCTIGYRGYGVAVPNTYANYVVAYAGGITNYSPEGYDTNIDLYHLKGEVYNATNGIYCHGGGSNGGIPLFNSKLVEDFRFDNITTPISSGGPDASTPAFRNGVIGRRIKATNTRGAFSSEDAYSLLLEDCEIDFTTDATNQRWLTEFVKSGQIVTIRNTVFRSKRKGFFSLAVNKLGTGGTRGTLILDGAVDQGTPDSRFGFAFNSDGLTSPGRYDLTIKGGTQLWDLMPYRGFSDLTLLPPVLTVLNDPTKAPVRFGVAGLGMAGIVALFASAGKTFVAPSRYVLVNPEGVEIESVIA
jgi:hypothetical protein